MLPQPRGLISLARCARASTRAPAVAAASARLLSSTATPSSAATSTSGAAGAGKGLTKPRTLSSLDPAALSSYRVMRPPRVDAAGNASDLPAGFRCVILGAPGSGKGSFSKYLSAAFRVPTISTGDLIRTEIKSGSDLGAKLEAFTSKGQLVDDHLVMSVLDKRMAKPDVANGYILDGFPRRASQAPLLEQMLLHLQQNSRARQHDRQTRKLGGPQDPREQAMRSEWEEIVKSHHAAGSVAYTSKEPDPVFKLMHKMTSSHRKDPVALFDAFLSWVWGFIGGSVKRASGYDDPERDAREAAASAAAAAALGRPPRLDFRQHANATSVVGLSLLPNVVLEVRLRDDIIVSKALGRRVCDTCGAGYNCAHIVDRDEHGKDIFMPAILPKHEGICDNCEGHLITRGDDTPDVIQTRIRSYEEETLPLLDYYRGQQLSVEVVDRATQSLRTLTVPMPVVSWDVHRGLWDAPQLTQQLASAVGGHLGFSSLARHDLEAAGREFKQIHAAMDEAAKSEAAGASAAPGEAK